MWRDDQQGSVLLLVPAAVLILVVLGAVAVDAAITFMGQRELQNATAAAATDAAVAALDERALYECGALRAAADHARLVAMATFLAREADTVQVLGDPEVEVRGLGTTSPVEVSVTARGRVDLLFGPAIAGLDEREVSASTTARAELEPGESPLPLPEDC